MISDPRVRFTLKIIEQHKGSIQLDIGETSRLLGLSEAYLLRLFHRSVGKTFREYLRDVRMIHARELLQRSSRSTKQIAMDCGYGDVNNFRRDFKIVHATTPKRFRLKLLAGTVRYAAAGQ
jgi:two-component system response regulator YesN